MRSLLERSVTSAEQRVVLLAPACSPVPDFFRNVPTDTQLHGELLADVQRLRGLVYVEDGAVRRDQLSSDGRYVTPEDARAWHLMLFNGGRISSCVWYLQHDNAWSVEDLRARSCPLNDDERWRDVFRAAVAGELVRARQDRLRYVELGGWAVAPDSRNMGDGLVLALAAYSLGRAFGGALGLTTATVRHASSTILRRLGGSSLEAGGAAVPPYYDLRYNCEMELLRFDSRRPNPRYAGVIDLLKDRLATIPVIACHGKAAPAVRAAAPALQWQPVVATGGAAA